MPELIEISGLDDDLAQEPSLPDWKPTWLGTIPRWVPYVIIGLGIVGLMSILRGGPGNGGGLFGLGDLGIIKRCRVKDVVSRKPRRMQRWCLWDSKGRRILGRHPSRRRALRQERLIQLKKRGLL